MLVTVQPDNPVAFEDEIDLRQNVTTLVCHWPMLPVQPQITGLPETTVGDQLEYLDDLAISLEARRQILQRRAESLQNDIRDMQERLAKAQALIATPAPAQVIQRAQSPDTPTSPKKTQNIALAAGTEQTSLRS